MRHFRRVASGTACALVLAGCGAATKASVAPKAAASPGIAYVANTEEPNNLNPILTGEAVSADIDAAVFDGLVAYLPSGYPKDQGTWGWRPQLATAVPTQQNGGVKIHKNGTMTVTYHLRHGVKFANGHSFTAQNIIDTWRLIMDPKSGTVSTAGYDLIQNIQAPNSYTVVMQFKKVYSPYLTLFEASVLPNLGASALNGGIAHSAFNQAPYGTGPFYVKVFKPHQYVELLPNPYYPKTGGWDGPKPSVKAVVYSIVSGTTTLVDQLKTGAVQYADQLQLDRTLSGELSAIPGLSVQSVPSLVWEQYTFNMQSQPVNNLAVRQAILYALNRQQDAAVLGPAGAYQVATTDQPPLSWAHDPNIPQVHQNVAQAKTLLRQAGWITGSNGYRYKNGKRLVIHIVTTSGNPMRQSLMQLTQSQLKAVGIQVIPEYQSANAMFGSTLPKGQFQMAEFSWIDSVDPDDSAIFAGPSSYGPSQFPPNGVNFGRYNNTQVDQWMYAALATVSQSQRQALYWKVQAQLYHDLPVIPLFYLPATYVVGPGLTGTAPNNFNNGLWNANFWSSSKHTPLAK